MTDADDVMPGKPASRQPASVTSSIKISRSGLLLMTISPSLEAVSISDSSSCVNVNSTSPKRPANPELLAEAYTNETSADTSANIGASRVRASIKASVILNLLQCNKELRNTKNCINAALERIKIKARLPTTATTGPPAKAHIRREAGFRKSASDNNAIVCEIAELLGERVLGDTG